MTYSAIRGSVLSVDATQLLKGILDVAVLAVLAEDDGYGYDIVRRLRESGLEEVGDASVYGTLRRLFDGGLLTSYVVPSEVGPARKYYGLTATGGDALRDSAKTWRRFVESVDYLIERAENRTAPRSKGARS
jgi:PadR family transcriptional regulator PadR